MLSLKLKPLTTRDPRRRRNLKASRRAKEARLNLQPRVDFLTKMPRLIQSIKLTDGMCDWSASECKDCKVGIATVACAASESNSTQRDTWEWRGPCCLVRVHRQLRRCLFTPTRKEDIWQGLTVQPQRVTHVKPQDHAFLTPVIEHVKSVEYLQPRKVILSVDRRKLISEWHQSRGRLPAKNRAHKTLPTNFSNWSLMERLWRRQS